MRNFHDIHCKYDRVLSIIYQRFKRALQKDEIFIVMFN